MFVQRRVVVAFPDRDEERTGVIKTIFMNKAQRPTSGATANDLAAHLRDIRTRTYVLDITARWTVDAVNFHSKSRNTPFAGRTLTGRAVLTLVGGALVHEANGPTP